MADPTEPPPRRQSRSRSRSPPRRPRGGGGRGGSGGGFRWKDKRSNDDGRNGDRNQDRAGLQRGYRERSPRRNRDRDDDRNRDADKPRDGGDQYRDRDSGRDRDRPRSPRRNRDREDGDRNRTQTRDRNDEEAGKPAKSSRPPPRKERTEGDRPPVRPAPARAVGGGGGGEEMIIVTVNDRLGTKAQIPALPSDTIKQFKVMVAMKIGREPHEILLKRQGERPFKDILTLSEYGISNGVQIDLEVDTGD